MTKEVMLPNDAAACHAIIRDMASQIAKLEKERDAALQLAFRKKAERYTNDPKQFVIDFGDSPEVADAAAGIADAAIESVGGYERRKPGTEKPRSEALPAHLPRYEVKLPVPADLKDCPTHGEREVIGYDWQESLEVVPPKLIVRRTGIPKLACKRAPECGVVEAERPVGLIEGNKYDTSVAAEIVVDKYAYHIPIYRQQDLFASCGWTPSRGTLLNIQKSAAEQLRPLVMHLREVVRAGPVIGTDDTTVTLITPQEMPDFDPSDPKSARAREVIAAALEPRRASVTARMWAYRSVTAPINLFDFTVSRHRDGPEIVLSGFEGTILADCYAGYESIELGSAGKIRRAACVAHARRKVFESRNNHPSHAALLLGLFQRLYDIEDRAKAFTAGDRRSLRQSESLPIWDEIGAYLASDAVANVMPKEPFGQAITYLRNNIEALRVHLEDGLVPIDNNDTEQLMKQVALGRKNWMFIGSIDAGNRAADLLSIVSSAARNDLDIFVYVKDVLDKLLGGSRDFEAMRPDVWKLAHPEAVRIYRQDERRHRAEVKSAKRAKRRAGCR